VRSSAACRGRTDEKWLDGTQNPEKVVYEYDDLGNLTRAADEAWNAQDGYVPVSQYTYTSDALGGITSVSMTMAGLEPTVTTGYDYYDNGKVESVQTQVGDQAVASADYAYDKTQTPPPVSHT
jgi:hypothetical protein